MNIDNRDIVNLSMGGGISYMIYLPNKDTDYIQNKIYKDTEPYELTMLKDIISRCKSNDIIVDVGSNIGNHTLFFAANNLFVYAFEANSALFNIMQDSIKLNKFDNLTKCYNVAVSDSVSKAKFVKFDETNLGGQSLEISDDGDIPTIPLDDVDFHGKVAVIKIDVEGMECNVLNGVKKLIAKDRPLLYVEAANMDAFKNLYHILDNLNYAYWDTFNATPTHLFLPKETLCEKDILTNSLNHQIFESYRIKQSLNYSKRHQNDINKVIDLSTKSIKLLEDKIETLEREKESFLSIQDEKNQELIEIKYEKSKLEDKIETLEKDFDKMKTNFIGMKARYQKELQDKNSVSAKNKTLNNSIEKLKTNFDGMDARNKKLITALSIKDDEICRIKNMLSFRLGNTIIKSTKSFSGFIKLPFSLYNDYKQYKSYIKAKNIEPKINNNIDVKNKKNINHIDNIKKVKIATIMDEFTFNSFKYECDLLQLTLNNWKNEISNFNPDMLFIESAWKGKDDSWATKVSNCSKELIELIQWCNNNKIKTIFWNKEDPMHFNTFLPVAKIVDYVFTTDIDCIGKYKYHLKHNNVYLLPFAAQPEIHNPIEKYTRKDAFNFAGSYYLRYPQRQIDFNTLINSIKNFKEVEIYDRNFDNPHPHYTFPEKFKPMILGKLAPNEIDKAYKGYKFGVNMNTVKQSQTMFARRVFELMASNTVVVSNFSRGVRNFFGDLVISSDNQKHITSKIQNICDDELYYQKFRLLGLRKVMQEHTYSDRLSFIFLKVFNRNFNDKTTLDTIILSTIKTEYEYNKILNMFDSQTYQNKTLFLINLNNIDMKNSKNYIHIFKSVEEALTNIEMGKELFFGIFSPNDYYGKNYINDIMLATKYSKCDAIGKSCHYEFNSDMVLKNQKDRYTYVNELNLTSSLCSIKKLSKDELKDIILSNSIKFDNMLSIDEFNYCKNGINASNQDLEEYIQDLEVSNSGISFNDEVYSIIDKIPPTMEIIDKDENLFNLAFDRLYDLLKHNSTINTKFSISNNKLIIDIKLAPKKHKYIYTDKVFTKEELNLVTNSTINLKSISTLENLYTVFEFQDINGNKISHSINRANEKHTIAIPSECEYVKFGLKLVGSGKVQIEKLILDNIILKPYTLLPKSKTLVLTKQYPSYDDLYKYGFLHSRIRAYKDSNLLVDIFRINKSNNIYREFEDIDVASGDATLLENTLKMGHYDKVLVHMIDSNMWSVLEKFIDKIKVIVWVHGAEIQVWQRRAYEFERLSSDEIARQKKLSANRVKFWHKLLENPHQNLHLVFVSEYFKDESLGDLGLSLSKDRYSIIHNYIDENIFKYQEKSENLRTKILTIRPYHSRTYANDMAVKAVQILSTKPFFKDLEFCFVGDGELFDDTTEPLKEFSNVKIEKKFLTQKEIKSYHDNYGIFLCPTRLDSQGVSRDEAMSSGLVAITTKVAAIPEFVDNKSGIVVEPENPLALAQAIEYLYHNPDAFLKLSKAGSNRVKSQSGFNQTILKEMELINE